MNQNPKESNPTDTAVYPTISLAEFMADLMEWKPALKEVPTKSRAKARPRKRINQGPMPVAKS